MTPRVVTVPIAALSVLLLLLAIGAAWLVRDMQERASGPIATSVASVMAAQELEISIREVSDQFNRYLISLKREELEPIPRLKARTATALAEAEKAATSPTEEALMRRVRSGYEHFFAEYERLLADPPQAGIYAEIGKLNDTVLVKEILEPAHEYLRLNEKLLTLASETNQQLARRLTVGLVAVGLFGSVGGLLGGWVIAAAVRRRLERAESTLRSTVEELDRAANPGSRPGTPPAPSDSTDPLERVSVSVSAVIRRLRETERAALRAEQLAWVGQMAAGIAHEIRNPLMAMKLLVQAVAERPGGAALRQRDLEVLEEEIGRLEQIVSGFLDYARPPRPKPQPVDVLECVLQTFDAVRARAESQNVELIVEPPGQPVVIPADPHQFRQVLLNLVLNALDAQPQGGMIRVGLRLEGDGTDQPFLELTVTDNGPGIDPAVADRIFEPFVSTKESGLGLGLSICRRIAEGHAGTLTAAAAPGGGAVFTLRLPAGCPVPAVTV